MTAFKKFGEAGKALETLATTFHPVSKRIIEALKTGEMAVGALEEFSGLAQDVNCQFVSRLERAGLVEKRRDKKRKFCSLNIERLKKIEAAMKELL